MPTIIVNDWVYRHIAVMGGTFSSMGVKLVDGSWSVLIDDAIYRRIVAVAEPGDTANRAIMRFVGMNCE